MTTKYWLASLVLAAGLLAPLAARAELVCITTYRRIRWETLDSVPWARAPSVRVRTAEN